MRDALRSADGAFLERTYRQYRHLADSLLAAGQDLEALRRYQLVASSWRGLRDLRALQKRVDRLENSDTVGKQRDREIETDRWESDRQQEFLPWLGALEEGVNDLDWQELVEELKLEDLQKDAQERTARGNAAQRVLEWTFARTSFYIQRRLLAVGNPSQAAVSLRIAAFIHPHLWHVWYNLACAHALAGENEAANDALSRAVDGGFDNLAHLENDADLATLRGTREFREIVARLR